MSPSVGNVTYFKFTWYAYNRKNKNWKKSKTDYHNIQDIGYLSEAAARWDTEKKHGKLSSIESSDG